MGAEKTLVNVNKRQDAYSVIGNYILNHVTAIEDMIAVIQINGAIIKELYMVDVDADGYFYWESDWWEGEEDVALLDFFPVSDAERIKWIPCSERLPEKEEQVLIYAWNVHYVLAKYREIRTCDGVYKMAWVTEDAYSTPREIKHEVICWMPLPEAYREGES